MTTTRRRYVDVPFGQVHVAEAGDGPPVVLLHQTPRSWDEFAEVLPLLGARGRRAIAVDLPGMGASDPHPEGATIEAYATGVIAALDGLDITTFDLVGHHTGGVVAVEVAATVPGRVRTLVLSSTPYVDAAARQRRRGRPAIDAVEPTEGGHHLTELWQRRQGFYPPGRPELLTRFVTDALRVVDPEAGHQAVGSYEMERRLPLVTARPVIVVHADDPHASPDAEPLAAALGGCQQVVIEGGMVPLEHTATEFARVVGAILDRA